MLKSHAKNLHLIATKALKAQQRPWLIATVIILTFFLSLRLVPPISLSTEQSLLQTRAEILKFSTKWHGLPVHVWELLAFARANGRNVPTLSSSGDQLVYSVLTEKKFVLKALHSDSYLDAATSNLEPIPNYAPAFRYQDPPQANFFVSPILLGSLSPDGNWFAELQQNRHLGTSQLLLRHTKETNLLYIVPHDRVEEFLWLPHDDRLLFTASSSEHYDGGIFVVQPSTQKLQHVDINVKKSNEIAIGQVDSSNYYVSIAGAALTENKIFVFAKKQESASLDARGFYHSDNLYLIDIDAPGRLRIQHAHAKALNLFKNVDLKAGLVADKVTLPAFVAWSSLKLAGPIEHVIDEWQTYTQTYAGAALLPYCLWYLVSIYDNAAQVARLDSDRQILRAYAREIAKALADHQLAPSYLRAIGTHQLEYLVENKSLPYQIANLVAPDLKSKKKP